LIIRLRFARIDDNDAGDAEEEEEEEA